MKTLLASISFVALMGIPHTHLESQEQDNQYKPLLRQIELLHKKVDELETRIMVFQVLHERELKEQRRELEAKVKQLKIKNKTAACANNLAKLWSLQNMYMVKFGGRMREYPTETGSPFWLKLTKTRPPLITKVGLKLLVCPFSNEEPRAGFTTYRGPLSNINRLPYNAIIGCCEPGIHPDKSICILRKSSDVLSAKPGEEGV